VLERARADDAVALHALFVSVLGEGRYFVTEPEEYTSTVDDQAARIATLSSSDRGALLVARLNRRVVGLVLVETGQLRRQRHVARLEILLEKESRGFGIGRLLMEAVITWATESPRITKLALTVFADNTRARALYEAMGFAVEGHRRGEYRERDGTLRDDLLMARRV